MKKVLVIGSKESGTKNDPQVISKTLQNAGLKAEFIEWEKLVFSIKTGEVSVSFSGIELSEMVPDLVIAVGWYNPSIKSNYREVSLTLGLYLEQNNINYWNSEMSKQRSTGKLSCLCMLALHGIHITQTTYSLSGDLIAPLEDFPVIIKATAASRGSSNHLVRSIDQAKRLLGEIPNRMIVQPYIKNDHDLRVIMIGGRAAKVLKRYRSDDKSHLNNTSQGGSAHWLDPREVGDSLLTICEKICKIMNREMAGIDFIPDDSSPYGYSCLEVNSIPQLTSGFDVEAKMNALVKSVKDNN
ncbi:hypothetical protein H6800_01700 [Candidatus Nomurabacteria bacterium]|nr:hypothetical protein [Candidatus Nomurabacteria bacterium]